ncbi:hypothetical protein GGI19_001824 [Coemansia pectinata]|uniref:Xylanolytic transcriptional activator regulatory domain-containing protein n=1 Tax=Coemansia pectinata TaxID=1052879 RepID=A0A9W8GY80_9FUNG|nr:hypothetical protein GGI19_001824 [Coemansia pectinata]
MSRFLAIDSLLNNDEASRPNEETIDREQSVASEATAVPSSQQRSDMTPPKTHFEYLPRWDEKMSPGEAMRRFYSAQFPAETREVVIFYFEYFYGICPIFHPATFLCRLVHGSVDPLLIDVMRAKTARLITKYTGRRVDLDAIIENINRRLLLDLESPTFDYIRAVVLMTTLSGGECKFMSYNSLVCLACSMVTRRGWNSLDLCARDAKNIPWLEWAELETQRRTFWIVYQLDAYQALLADRPVSISDARLHTGTPGSDCTWDDISISQILHWPTRHLQSIDKATIINTGALSYTFIDVCDLTVLLSQINQFMWSIRQRSYAKQLPCRSDLLSGMSLFVDFEADSYRSQPAVRSSLFELPRFRELHEALRAWCKRLVPADDLKGIGTTLGHFSQFGNLGHRQHLMRVRYFCLHCYYVPFLHLLHLANRPSFFKSTTTAVPEFCSSEEYRVLREMLSSSFSGTTNDSLLAYDVVEESWQICLDSIFDLSMFLERNSDISLERSDQITPFCLFTSITVLIRHIRKCRCWIEQNGAAADGGCYGSRVMERSLRVVRQLWAMLKDLGFLWGVRGMEKLLRQMQVEEVINAADLLSGLSL